MGSSLDQGPSLPWWLLLPATLLLIFPFLLSMRIGRSTMARFMTFVPWARYMSSAYHTTTFHPLVGGMSINALLSASVFSLGLLLVKRKHLLMKLLIPCYVMIFIVILSSFANRDYGGGIDAIVKFGYLVVITIGIYEALGQLGEQRMTRMLLWSFAPPLLFQVLSVVFHVSKANESDGSVSYIGGYNHEAAFSIVLATCFIVACFSGLKGWRRGLLLVLCLAGILLANYRTTIIAIAPMAFVQFNADVIAKFTHRQRVIIGIAVLVISGLGMALGAWILRDRLADIVTAISDLPKLAKPAIEYTADERRILSGRPYIWSAYIYAYMNGTTMRHLIGFGPNAWDGVFTHYAHNTLVSSLYEYGVIGVVAMLYLWGNMFFAALRVRQGPRTKLLAAHISFFLINMATMGHWMIEGDILYGIICGYTLHLLYRRAPVPVEAQAPTLVQQRRRPIAGAARPAE